MSAIPLHKKIRKLGGGDGVERMMKLFVKITNGVASDQDREEYKMVKEGLNYWQIEVGFDCDSDGIPDTVDIFRQNVENLGCCPLIPTTSRTKKTSSGRRKKK
tara:strand:- start:1655 stop:1963 length:309 start_codon:yes stop_codon:yes gene_type:complete